MKKLITTALLSLLIFSQTAFTMFDDQKKAIEVELDTIILFTRSTPPIHKLNANLVVLRKYRSARENLTRSEFSQGIEFIKNNLKAKHNAANHNEQYKLQQQLEFLIFDQTVRELEFPN